MNIKAIEAGTFLCDGGGIFGGVPKILWKRHIQSDDNNLIRISMRCLLVESGNRKLLIETGAGSKHQAKFAKYNGVTDTLLDALYKAGVTPEEVTDVLLTHLHWDHCGGNTRLDGGEIKPVFKNALYYCSKEQYDNMVNPNPREGDAYFKDDILPLEEAGLLRKLEKEMELMPGVQIRFFNGHTPGMIVPIIDTGKKKLTYVSDLAPLAANVPLKWISAYDSYPVTSMQEKAAFFREVFNEEMTLYFEHDPVFEACTLKWDNKKGPLVDQLYKVGDYLAE